MKKISLSTLLIAIVFCSFGIVNAQSNVLVPAYFFPYDNVNPGKHNVGPHWSTLIDAAKQYGNRLVVVANPNNGPGSGSGWEKQKYTEAINKVRAEGGVVVGYVYTCYGLTHHSPECSGRTLAQIQSDISKWKQWYNVDGIFLDEASTDAGKVAWYQTVDQTIQSNISNALIVSNYGTKPAAEYYTRPGIHVIMENTAAQLDENARLLNNPPSESAALIHTTTDGNWSRRMKKLGNKGIKYRYVTDDGFDSNPWDSLPSFFMRLFK